MEFTDLPPISSIYNIKITQYKSKLKKQMMVPGLGQIDAFYPILVEIWDEHKNYGFSTIGNFQNSVFDSFGTAVTFEALRSDVIPYWMARVKTRSSKTLLEHANILHSMNRYNPYAVSGIEMALWDLIGKRSYLSMAELIWMVFFEISNTFLQFSDIDEMITRVKGGVPLKFPVGFYEDLDDYDRLFRDTVNFGVKKLKLHIIPNLDSITKIMNLAKNKYPSLKIETDARGSFNPLTNGMNIDEVIDFYKKLNDYNCTMHEQPLQMEISQEENIRKLMRALDTPIGFDEGIYSLNDVKWIAKLAQEEQKPITLNIRIHRLGGLVECLKVLNFIELFNSDNPQSQISITTGSSLEQEPTAMASTSLNSLPFEFLETDLFPSSFTFEKSIFDKPMIYRDGRVFANESGLGNSFLINKQELEAVKIKEFDYLASLRKK